MIALLSIMVAAGSCTGCEHDHRYRDNPRIFYRYVGKGRGVTEDSWSKDVTPTQVLPDKNFWKIDLGRDFDKTTIAWVEIEFDTEGLRRCKKECDQSTAPKWCPDTLEVTDYNKVIFQTSELFKNDSAASPTKKFESMKSQRDDGEYFFITPDDAYPPPQQHFDDFCDSLQQNHGVFYIIVKPSGDDYGYSVGDARVWVHFK
jgi:hypothetical protein